jgi:hypothetical protein
MTEGLGDFLRNGIGRDGVVESVENGNTGARDEGRGEGRARKRVIGCVFEDDSYSLESLEHPPIGWYTVDRVRLYGCTGRNRGTRFRSSGRILVTGSRGLRPSFAYLCPQLVVQATCNLLRLGLRICIVIVTLVIVRKVPVDLTALPAPIDLGLGVVFCDSISGGDLCMCVR